MRRYEQGSSHRLKAVGFRPNYAEGIFMKITKKQLFNILNKGNINNCFLNDGHESMTISINDLNIF